MSKLNHAICTNGRQACVIQAVIGERDYQDKKWGSVDERPREVGTYLTLIRKLLTDAERAYAESIGDDDALNELRKVVAVGVACFENHGCPSRIDSQEERSNINQAIKDYYEKPKNITTRTDDAGGLMRADQKPETIEDIQRKFEIANESWFLHIGNRFEKVSGNPSRYLNLDMQSYFVSWAKANNYDLI